MLDDLQWDMSDDEAITWFYEEMLATHDPALPRFYTRVGRVETVRRQREALNRIEAFRVRAARADGASWAEIGEALGISKQSAWKRFGQLTPAKLTEPWDAQP